MRAKMTPLQRTHFEEDLAALYEPWHRPFVRLWFYMLLYVATNNGKGERP